MGGGGRKMSYSDANIKSSNLVLLDVLDYRAALEADVRVSADVPVSSE